MLVSRSVFSFYWNKEYWPLVEEWSVSEVARTCWQAKDSCKEAVHSTASAAQLCKTVCTWNIFYGSFYKRPKLNIHRNIIRGLVAKAHAQRERFSEKVRWAGFFFFFNDCTLKTNLNYSLNCSPVVRARSYYITPLWFYPLHSLHPARDRFCLCDFQSGDYSKTHSLLLLQCFLVSPGHPGLSQPITSWPYHKEANRNLCILVPLRRSGCFSSFISASTRPSRIPSSEDLFYLQGHTILDTFWKMQMCFLL